jgi:hypothetical protein
MPTLTVTDAVTRIRHRDSLTNSSYTVAMAEATTENVFRVTVRGRFADLTDEARRYLSMAQAEHDIFVSAYTTEGTLTYDARIDFFNLRYEIRSAATDAGADAAARALDEAARFLTTMKFGHRDLKVDVVEMSAVWND